MAEAYFVSHIDPIFQISLIYVFIGCSQSVQGYFVQFQNHVRLATKLLNKVKMLCTLYCPPVPKLGTGTPKRAPHAGSMQKQPSSQVDHRPSYVVLQRPYTIYYIALCTALLQYSMLCYSTLDYYIVQQVHSTLRDTPSFSSRSSQKLSREMELPKRPHRHTDLIKFLHVLKIIFQKKAKQSRGIYSLVHQRQSFYFGPQGKFFVFGPSKEKIKDLKTHFQVFFPLRDQGHFFYFLAASILQI